MENIKEIADLIQKANNIAIFTGAGISVASGIPDFRSANGLYNQESGFKATPEEIISHSFFVKYPLEFYKFYKEKMIYENATYNEAHKFFAKLEKLNKNITVITQNIDGLHSLSGSTNVLELHGSIHRNYCMKCHKFHDLNSITKNTGIPKCNCGGTIKPDVVLYEENLDYFVLTKSINAISKADLLIVVGTSLIVQPAASLITYFEGGDIVLINKEKTPYDRYASVVINDDVIKVVSQLNPIILR